MLRGAPRLVPVSEGCLPGAGRKGGSLGFSSAAAVGRQFGQQGLREGSAALSSGVTSWLKGTKLPAPSFALLFPWMTETLECREEGAERAELDV